MRNNKLIRRKEKVASSLYTKLSEEIKEIIERIKSL
jgi:hypothetical protein